ncbi:MAG: hypothetical protein LBS74_00320 [Oscillospiraceae bacterium]|jgi:adenylate cyclase class IV|nr:hypothetical protein [Oscillospiraceae bacterium]
MSNVKIYTKSIPEIKYFSRQATQGQEFEMVKSFITYIEKKYSKLTYKKIAIFIEPQIGTGYPDIVLVEYYEKKVSQNSEFRKLLTDNDLKVLLEVQRRKNTSVFELSNLLGYQVEEIKRILSKLYKANFVHISSTLNYVRNVPLGEYFEVKKIISIEAKIDKWSEAIRQAATNSWFSSESYVLLNKESCSETIINKCKQQGIGVILVNGKIEKKLESNVNRLPVSYVSLKFNEWIQSLKEFEH